MPQDDVMMDWDTHWAEFRTALDRSLMNIKPPYFRLERDRKIVLRERAYCYELYHQLRCNLPDNLANRPNLFVLHGEIDKSGQEAFSEIFNDHPPNPDFVYHGPGYGENNFVIMEVKSSSNCSVRTAQKDIKKIEKFINEIGYRHGIFLIFGSIDSRSREKNISGLIDKLNLNEDLILSDKLMILWHKECGQRVEVLRGTLETNLSAPAQAIE